jgi:hypothetical protein
MVDTSVQAKPSLRFLLVVAALAIVGALSIACTRSSSPASSESAPQAVQGPRQAGAPLSNAPVRPLVCPTFSSSPVAALPQAKGGHRVILSWRASPPADSKHADAVGYCIYRGNQSKDPQPVLINSAPFPATRCMDDLVESGKKYYYVVRAISAKGVTSTTSNSAPAAIPTRERTEGDVPGKSAPLCRDPAIGK